MNPVFESLLEVVNKDPYPAAHTSSYWQEHGQRNVIERRGEDLILQGWGIGAMARPWFFARALHVLERLSYRRVTVSLASFPIVWQSAKRLAHDLSFGLTFDAWKHAVALATLTDHWAAHGLSPRTFAVIGDGYGFLGALIRRQVPGSRLFCIDLPKTLMFQAKTHELANRSGSMSLLSSNGGGSTDVTFVLPQDVEKVVGTIDCAVNIASMQEMNQFTIASYFTFLRRRSALNSRFYCVNRLRKELPGGEIASFADYPWRQKDQIFIDGPCPYYTHFFAPYTLPNGPKVLGIRIPWINYFDGVHMHRLVRLAPLD